MAGTDYPFVHSPDSPMAGVYRTLEKVLDHPTTVLIEGESGSGKDAMAAWLHYHGSRRNGPFIKINLAALPEDLVESELFGYERGAFTGAMAAKPGKLELAEGGTLVFDEISNLDWGLQAKLVGVVETKEFYRLGGRQPVRIDARIVGLSSVSLAGAVEQGSIRQDLFFRFNLITVRIPALRERRSEIFTLAETLVEGLGRRYHRPACRLHPDCRRILEGHDFPGNARELRNGLERALLRTHGEQIMPTDLPSGWRTRERSSVAMASLEDVEREHIRNVLEHTRGRKQQAAEILGITRKTLLEKRKKYGLD